MLAHVLGWIDVAATAGVAGYVMHYLAGASRETRTWLRKLPVPAFSAVPLTLSSGADFVGPV